MGHGRCERDGGDVYRPGGRSGCGVACEDDGLLEWVAVECEAGDELGVIIGSGSCLFCLDFWGLFSFSVWFLVGRFEDGYLGNTGKRSIIPPFLCRTWMVLLLVCLETNGYTTYRANNMDYWVTGNEIKCIMYATCEPAVVCWHLAFSINTSSSPGSKYICYPPPLNTQQAQKETRKS